MLSIKDCLLRVHKSDTSPGYDFEIDGENVESVTTSRRVNRRKDEGQIVIHNDDGQFSTTDREITVGDRVDFYVAPQQAPTGWGVDGSGWGYGGWGGYLLWWSCFVTEPSYVRSSATVSDIVLSGTDYVFSLLSNRLVYDNFEDDPIAGTDDAILNSVIRTKAPAVDLTHVDEFDETASIAADGTNLLDFCDTLARRAGAVMYGWGDRLAFEDLDVIETEFVVDPSDDIGTFEHDFDGTTVSNTIRVDGGTDHAIDDQQTTLSEYRAVSQNDRFAFQIQTRKSQIDRIELWTRNVSSASVNVRIQKDDGGEPVAIDDSDSDIDNHQLSHDFISNDDYTTFLMNDHDLPEPNPWIIVETDSDSEQDIGADSGGADAVYRAHYPFPISVQVRDSESIRRHTVMEERFKKDNIASLDAAKEMADEGIEHTATPESETSFPALSRRAHRLDPGEVITLDMPRERAVGDYMVTETEDTFDGATINTTLTVEELSSI